MCLCQMCGAGYNDYSDHRLLRANIFKETYHLHTLTRGNGNISCLQGDVTDNQGVYGRY